MNNQSLARLWLIVLAGFSLWFLQPASAQSQPNTSRYSSELILILRQLKFNWAKATEQERWMNDGLDSLKGGNWKVASALFTGVINDDPSSFPAYLFRSGAYYLGGRKEWSDRDAQFIQEQLGRNVHAFSKLWAQYASIQSAESEQWLPFFEGFLPIDGLIRYVAENRTTIDQESFELVRQGLFLMLVGKVDESISQANVVLSTKPNSLAYYLKAAAYQILLEPDSAATSFERLLLLDRDVVEAKAYLVNHLSIKGDLNGAKNYLLQLAENSLVSVDLARFTGVMRMRVLDYEGAEHDLSRYLREFPDDIEATKQLAIARMHLGKYKESIEGLEGLLKVADLDLDIYVSLSDSYFFIGDTAASVSVLRKASRKFGFNQVYDLYFADRLVDSKDLKQAQSIIDRVIKVVKLNDFPSEWLKRAEYIQCRIYLQKGQAEMSQVRLNQLISADGEKSEYLFLKARILIVMNRKEEARDILSWLSERKYLPALVFSNRLLLD
ncbi:MAG: hypothetical protein JNN04_14015 [Cyclobacteriaceae bacterium]|nr:hypothetical protein [Cyclobacteriaceae bacterium]